MKNRMNWFVVAIIILVTGPAGASIVLRAASTGSEGNTRYTDYAQFDIDGSGSVTNAGDPTYRDFDVTGSITNADAFNNSFTMNWGAMGSVNTNAGEDFGALVTAAGIDRASAGDLGVRGNDGNGIDQNEGYFFGLDLSNLDPSLAFQITKVAFSAMSNPGAEQATFVNRNDTSKTLVVDSNPTNPNVDVSGLDLMVQGGTSDSELLSVFNSSATVQSWRIISLELEPVPAPNTASSVSITSTNPSDGMSTLSLDVNFDGTGGAASSSSDFSVGGGLSDSNAFNQGIGLTFDAAAQVDTTSGAEVTDGTFNRSLDGSMGVQGGYGGGVDQHEGIGVTVDTTGITSSNFMVQVMSVQVRFVDSAESLTIINRQDPSKKLTFGGSSSGADVVIPSTLTDLDVSRLNLWVSGGDSNEVAMIFGNEMPGGFAVYGVRVEAVPVGSVHAIFQDHMVLQRDVADPVWGKGHPGTTISLLLDDVSAGSTVVDSNGDWMVRMEPHAQDGGIPHVLEVDVAGADPIVIQDVIFGDVYLASGQSNMEFEMWKVVGFSETEANADNPLIRQVKILPAKSPSELYEPVIATPWERTTPESIGHFSAVAYFFAKKMVEQTGVPVGILNASYGGQRINRFINPEGMARVPELAGEMTAQEQGLIGSLYEIYNAMIGPLVPCGICGVLWYQGETDRYAPARYEQKMQALIRGYRAVWNDADLPFYYFQLPNYNTADPYTLIRDAQLRALSEPDTGMAVLIDAGDDSNIHPTNKQDPGSRLAQWALAKQFGQDIVYSGPIVHDTLVEGSQIRVLFDYADGGLMIGQKVSTNPVVEVVGGELQNFEIAGADRVFTSAVATIESDTVVVSAPTVSAPQYVRYCYQNAPSGANKLYNRAGLPAAAFRTDESFDLEVVSGSGSAERVEPGAVLSITADAAPPGQVFDRWIGAAGAVSNLNSASTTITMPAQDVYLVATYRDSAASSYTVSVVNGAGDGTAQEGSRVSIEADPAPPGMVFDVWTGDVQELMDASASSTTLRMPETNVAVQATYRTREPETKPIMTGFSTTDGLVDVSFASEQGMSYEFEASTNLVSGIWSPEVFNIKGDGFEKTVSLPLGEQHQKFFHLRLR